MNPHRIGEWLNCGYCGDRFKKKAYNQAYCHPDCQYYNSLEIMRSYQKKYSAQKRKEIEGKYSHIKDVLPKGWNR